MHLTHLPRSISETDPNRELEDRCVTWQAREKQDEANRDATVDLTSFQQSVQIVNQAIQQLRRTVASASEAKAERDKKAANKLTKLKALQEELAEEELGDVSVAESMHANNALQKACLMLSRVETDDELDKALLSAQDAIGLAQNALQLVAAEKRRIEQLTKMLQVQAAASTILPHSVPVCHCSLSHCATLSASL